MAAANLGLDRLAERQQALLLTLLSTGISRAELVDTLQSGSAQGWDERLRDFTAKNLHVPLGEAAAASRSITRGSEVVLTGGSGKKRKHNGAPARVVRYPKIGRWMTVRLVHDNDEEGDATAKDVKWRKGGYKATATQSCLLGLSDNSLAHIVGYLCHGAVREEGEGGANTTTGTSLAWLVDAALVSSNIASVCRRFLQFANDSMRYAVGYIDANFDGLKEEHIIPCVLWLSKHKLRLGRIKMRIDLADVPLMCRLLQQCDTDKVQYVQALDANHGNLWNIKDSIENSGLIRKAWLARFCDEDQVVNLIGREAHPRIDRMAADLDVAYEATSWKELHDTIAVQCPNASHLILNAKIPADPSARAYWRRHHFSSDLFSSSSVRNLQLLCGFCVERALPSRVQVDSRFVHPYIQGLGNLESLEIGFTAGHLAQGLHRRRIIIESKTLRSLDVEKLGKGAWVSCNCSKLERFVCAGSLYGNGSRPNFTFEEMLAHRGDVMHTESVDMVGLGVVSADCQCILKGFSHYAELCCSMAGYYQESYLAYVLPAVRNARFWTYPEESNGRANNAST